MRLLTALFSGAALSGLLASARILCPAVDAGAPSSGLLASARILCPDVDAGAPSSEHNLGETAVSNADFHPDTAFPHSDLSSTDDIVETWAYNDTYVPPVEDRTVYGGWIYSELGLRGAQLALPSPFSGWLEKPARSFQVGAGYRCLFVGNQQCDYNNGWYTVHCNAQGDFDQDVYCVMCILADGCLSRDAPWGSIEGRQDA